MRLPAVVGDELLGADDARDWAFLESLVAVNGPGSIDVEVLALINEPAPSIVYGNPLGRAAGRMATGLESSREPYDAAESARQRLSRSLQHLRSLGMHATGGIEQGDPYRLVRSKAADGKYDRVVLLLRDKQSWLARLLHQDVEARLRRSLNVPVQTVGHADLAPPGARTAL
jgi:hypothetical protein